MAVRIDIGGRDMLAAKIDKQNKAWAKTLSLLKQNVNLGKEGSKEMRRLIEAQQTPQERYNRTLAKAKVLLDGTKEGQRAYAKVIEAANRRLEKQGKAHRDAFGPAVLSNIKSVASQYLGVAAAIAVATRALRAYEDLSESAVSRVGTAAESRALLKQVSGGSQSTFDRLLSESKSQRRGFTTEIEANTLKFALRSAGIKPGQQQLFFDLAGQKAVQNVPQFAGQTKAFQTATLGKAGSVRDIASQAIAASGIASAKVDEVLQAATQSAGGGTAIGFTPQELLAGAATLSRIPGNAPEAGTQLRAFAKAIGRKEEFAGTTLEGAVDRISGKNLTIAQQIKFFGREEAAAGFRGLSSPEQRGILRQTTAGLKRSIQEDLVGRTLNIKDPLADPVRRSVSAKIQTDIVANETLSTREAAENTAVANARRRGIQRGFGPARMALLETDLFLGDVLGQDPHTLSQAADDQGYILNRIAAGIDMLNGHQQRKPEAVPTVEK